MTATPQSRIEALEEENRQLRALVTPVKDEILPGLIPGLTRTQRRILLALLARSPFAMTTYQLAPIVWPKKKVGDPYRNLATQICHARKHLAPFQIEIRNVYHHGHCLPAPSAARLRALMQGAAV